MMDKSVEADIHMKPINDFNSEPPPRTTVFGGMFGTVFNASPADSKPY